MRLGLTVFLVHFVGVLLAQNPYPEVFEDEQLLAVKENATDKEIDAIKEPGLKNLAEQLKTDSYDAENRHQAYEHYLHPKILAKQLKTNPYSQYENPTGIYFKNGDEAQLWVNNPEEQKISLRITNWDDKHFAQKDYPLKNGYNSFKVEHKGNAYIQYFTKEEQDLPDIEVHMLSGEINGVFDVNTHDNKDWKDMLENAYGPVIDLSGNHVSLA